MKRLFLLTFLIFFLMGCAPQEETAAVQAGAFVPAVTVHALSAEVLAREAEALREAPLPAVPVILESTAPGTEEERCGSAVIDFSNHSQGYVMAQYFGTTDARLKLRVTGPTTTYTYNLPKGEWTVFPLSDGNGSYQVTIYENISGNRYACLMAASFEVSLEDEFAPFLRPNQYVNYTDAPNTMDLGAQLTTGLTHPLEKVAAVYDYVVEEFTYDYEKAASVKSGYLPVLDEVLEKKSGICFDYAAVMTAMLRSQEVPCKLVVGYAGKVYHAWISVWTEEDGWIDGAIFFDGQVWKRMDPTFASSSHRSDEIMDFIENGSYVTKYLY